MNTNELLKAGADAINELVAERDALAAENAKLRDALQEWWDSDGHSQRARTMTSLLLRLSVQPSGERT